MKFEIRNRIAVLALGAGLLLGATAPQIARADANPSVTQSGTVLVPRLVKGARTAEMVRVPAGQYNANGFTTPTAFVLKRETATASAPCARKPPTATIPKVPWARAVSPAKTS